ncbi:EndoU domain-containing protein [Streptomyces erythrochromogenes]|uniref:EndoU domain-containing protein n=1 Tax=Streptomyces erythrochromogenes TaxID=285574 RepID=UPI0033ECCCD4
MIDVGKIPTFTGNLDTLETHAAALKTTASGIRGTGRDVHNAFQALDPVYDAPEQGELLNSTIPVRDKADAFATKLESVSGALTGFASSARPLVDKMKQLRIDAEKFVADNKDDEDWQQDQGKIDENARLVREVGVTWVAFQGVERDAANKITTLVGGTHFVVDDGSHKAGMYGFKESDVKDAKETPWGTADEREYTGLRAAWEWTKDNVGSGLKGFFVDGVWGTLKGLGNMVNVFDMDTFKKTWSGIGDVFAGVSGYIITPYDWAMDKMFGPVDHSDREKSKAALRNFGKSLVAWDEWGKDPARAGGTVLFNVLTLGAGSALKLGRAGKLGVGSEIATVVGKAGVLVDPMSYLGKAANVTKIKVGDFMEGLKASRAGVDDMARNLPGGTSPHPADTTVPPGYEYADPQGNKRVVGHDGTIRDEHGNVVPDTEPVREPHKDDLPNTHEPAPAKERVLEGAGGPSRVENSTGHPTNPAHLAGGSHAPGGHAGESPTAHVPAHGNGHGPSSGAGLGTPHTGAAEGRGATGGGSHQHGGSGAGHGGDGSSGGSGRGAGQHDTTGHGSASGHAGDPHDPTGHGDSGHDPTDLGTGQPGTESGPGKTGDSTTPQQDPPTVEELPPLPKGGRIPEHTFEHVLQGELKYDRNGNPKVSGYHFRPEGRDLNPYMVKVPRIIEIDHKTGLTTGNVWMRDPRTGEMVMKRAKTTFFPPGWSEKQVRRAMEKSFENGRVVDAATNKWRGDWKGITFEGYFDPITGDAKTIYPLMPK